MKKSQKSLSFRSETIVELNTDKMGQIKGGSPINFTSTVRCLVDAIIELTSDDDNENPGCLTV